MVPKPNTSIYIPMETTEDVVYREKPTTLDLLQEHIEMACATKH